ncbi:putative F-box protein At1g47730 [Eutrema salsugineum]|uniref:putative F-box protein At1g47730 n=1 Tax=Eutrema salsugineum TaxID=72664 RepID=UPI000CED453C|nr:putative F-box protein At1g47730 [Eutrema salsugineum]
MKQREEKTENIKRKRRRQSSSSSLLNSTSSLPLDIASEILLKLPAKSVLRFRCVSKLWSSIITEPNFTDSFQTRRPKRLLLFFKEGERFFVFSLPQHNPNPNESYSYYSSQPIDSYHMTYPKRCSFTMKTESVHGLICFQRSANPIVWNPSIRKLLPLPKPDKTWKDIKVFLGYDPVEGKHKVMCMPGHPNSSDECRVLTLGSSDQEPWRRVKCSHNHSPFTGKRKGVYHGRCINGVLYYLAHLGNEWVIMSFDVRSEKFINVITIPYLWPKIYWYRMMVMMISYQGKLACVGSSGNSISLWILEDAEKQEWSNDIFSPLSNYDQGLQNFKLVGVTDDGELVYVQNTAFKCVPVIYVDPKRQTFRRIEFRGIADDDFRQRNGLGDRRLRDLQSFPNHIETLLSL